MEINHESPGEILSLHHSYHECRSGVCFFDGTRKITEIVPVNAVAQVHSFENDTSNA